MSCAASTQDLNRQESRRRTESELLGDDLDFQAAYLAVKNLNFHIQTAPDFVTSRTVDALIRVIESPAYDSQRQVLFLYREASEGLLAIVASSGKAIASAIIRALDEILASSSSHRHRATAEALASLPVCLLPPCPVPEPDTGFSRISLPELTRIMGISDPESMVWRGRSLAGFSKDRRTGVIKFIKANEDPYAMTLETLWMNALASLEFPETARFDIPVPVSINRRYLLKINDLPEALLSEKSLHPEGFAIAFSAAHDYYRYPNDCGTGPGMGETEFRDVMGRNAWLLGKTASMGLIHTAPIPLFHNRVQQGRREDGGIYQWQRGGRLDQWLESCRHPNFSSSGLRDFEHFSSLQSTRELLGHLGSHLLSMILVTGSYFRNKAPEQRGITPDGNPVDARHLFNPDTFGAIIRECARRQFYGFTGIKPDDTFPDLPDSLVDNLIQAMGIDIHMEEVLRTEDQNAMTREQFERFLTDRGFPEDAAGKMPLGHDEIRILTGPHLGGFNQRISVPEIIDFIFSCSSRCIAGRYISENGLNPDVK